MQQSISTPVVSSVSNTRTPLCRMPIGSPTSSYVCRGMVLTILEFSSVLRARKRRYRSTSCRVGENGGAMEPSILAEEVQVFQAGKYVEMHDVETGNQRRKIRPAARLLLARSHALARFRVTLL